MNLGLYLKSLGDYTAKIRIPTENLPDMMITNTKYMRDLKGTIIPPIGGFA
jgi:hypothetical protein